MTSFAFQTRRLAFTLMALALSTPIGALYAQDARLGDDAVRVQHFQAGALTAPADPQDAACPMNVPVGATAVAFNGDVTTTAPQGISYAVEIQYTSDMTGGALEHTDLVASTGTWSVSPGTGETFLILAASVTPAQPLHWEATLIAQAAGTVSYTFETFLNGASTRQEDCTFEIVDTVVGSFHGVAFLDLDGDGMQTTDEPGLVGRMIFNDINDNAQYDPGVDPSMPTDSMGNYVFTDVELPTTLGQEIPQGWEGTFPVGGFHTINEDGQQANFGSRPRSGAILGAKWEDRNNNGVLDDGEPLLPGWQIYLDLNNNGMLDDGEPSAMTDEGGRYAIGDLAPGTYTVREVPQEGFEQTHPQNPDHHTVTLGQGQYAGGISFGNRQAEGSIHGVKYLDLNANGQRDDGEPGLDGVTIRLTDDDSGALIAETVTMAMEVGGDTLHGVYWFDDVPPDTYELFEVVPSGFVVTEPPETMGPFGPVNSHLVVLLPGEQEEGVNFGNARAVDVALRKEGPGQFIEEGALVTYTLTVTNSSNDAPNTVVRDTLDARLEFISATTTQGTCSFSGTDRVVTCNLGTLASGATVTIKIVVRVGQRGENHTLINEATVKSDRLDAVPQNNHSETRSNLNEQELDIAKEASSQEVKVGERITYTIVARSRFFSGQAVITDTLSEKVEFVSVSTSRADLPCTYEAASRVVACGPKDLSTSTPPDTIRIEVVAVQPGTYSNVATVMEERENLINMHADTVEVTITEADPTPTEPGADLPDAFVLYDSYPNPFNPETVIRFDVPHRARLRLEVVDVLGRVAATLVDREMPPGRHHAVFEASGLPSGVYFYRITAGVFRETKSMILLK